MDSVIAFLIIAYLFPTLLALLRGHHNTLAIFALNLLLGWTAFGWIIAFVWSLTATLRPVVRPVLVARPAGEIATTWGLLPVRERVMIIGVGSPILIIAAAIVLLLVV
jgi:hypothetical protein